MLAIADGVGAKLNRKFDKKVRGERPIFILPIIGVAALLLIMSLLITFLPTVPSVPNYIGLNEITNYPLWVDWFGSNAARPISVIAPSISISLFGLIYLWLIRSMLPEKYKPCLPWLKPEGE